jgi:hypothetical protein
VRRRGRDPARDAAFVANAGDATLHFMFDLVRIGYNSGQ